MKDFKEFLNEQGFDFTYHGKPLSCYGCKVTTEKTGETANEERYLVRYAYDFGVTVEKEVTLFPALSAASSVITLVNESGKITEPFSNIKDFCGVFSFDAVPDTRIGFAQDKNTVKLYRYDGARMTHGGFLPDVQHLFHGATVEIDNRTGRCSDGYMPFFHLNQGERGVALAVGWSGNWRARFHAEKGEIAFESAVAGTEFYMVPGERLRLSSLYAVFYEKGGYAYGQNRMKRLIKYLASEHGNVREDTVLPVATNMWGAMPSDRMIENVEFVNKEKLGTNYIWIDAGWYGYSSMPCLNEHEGDWGCHTGSWVVNKNYHPDGMKEVAAKIKEHGMGFILWLEPERVIVGTDITVAHPDWFFKRGDGTWLLDLGNEDALKDTVNTLSHFIEELGMTCYRQDFNVDPLEFWQKADEPGRKGISQIKHINGLYRFWDALLKKYPYLIIDNCASGGRRLDVELMSRSVSLWRTDYTCGFEYDSLSIQNHNTGISALLPYAGMGLGNAETLFDIYDWRSHYAFSMSQRFFMYENWENPKKEMMERMKKFNEEYLAVQKYFSEDFYNLIDYSYDERSWGIAGGMRAVPDSTQWAAWQYNRPEVGDGIVMAFRRENSPFPTAELKLFGLDEGATYEFTDKERGRTWTATGKELMKAGLTVTLSNKRESLLFRYQKV